MSNILFSRIISKFDISDSIYALGVEKDEAYCILFNTATLHWDVFYAERGKRNMLLSFEKEYDALRYLCGLIILEVWGSRLSL